MPQLTGEGQPFVPVSPELDSSIAYSYTDLSDIALFKAAASSLGIDDSLESTSAQFLLLLHLLPDLHVLHIALPNDRGVFDDLMAGLTALQPVATLPIGLQSLRYFYCCTSMDNIRGIVPELLMTIMNLPSIETILVQLIDADYQKSTADALVGSSCVENLCFKWAPVAPSLLNAMLKIPVALKSFRYSTMMTTRSDFRCMGITLQPLTDLRELGVALEPHRTSLECLHVEIATLDGGDGGTRIPMESLRDWPALVKVRCALTTLLGKGPQTRPPVMLVDMLPAGLQELEILLDRIWSERDVVREVVVMLGQKRDRLPELRTLVVLRGTEKSPELLVRLLHACIAAGVDLIEDESYLMIDCFTNVGRGGEGKWPVGRYVEDGFETVM